MARNCEAQTRKKVEQIENPESREAAERFIQQRRANSITWRTLRGDLETLRNLANFHPGKPFEDIEKNDLVKYLASITEKYADSMLAGRKADVKKFYRWLEGDGEKYPSKVAWIKASPGSSGDGGGKDPDVLLTPGDVKALKEACDHPRDRAILAVLYESGARPHELTSLNVKNASLDQKGAVIRLNPEASDHTKLKTGTRRIRLINSSPNLEEWIRNHPEGDDPEAPLWISFANPSYGERLSTSGLRGLINRIGDRSGLDKNLTPYLFRHSRATQLAREGFSEQDMKIMLGWTGGSDMPETYIHMSGADVENKILRFHGLLDEDEDEEPDPLKPWSCPRCDYRNPSENQFCGQCALARSLEAAQEIEEREQRRKREVLEQLTPEEVYSFAMRGAEQE